jgi:hypothetical protein
MEISLSGILSWYKMILLPEILTNTKMYASKKHGDPLTRDPNIHKMYATCCTLILLLGILTYTKCMLVKNTVIPLPGILTYTKCMLIETHITLLIFSLLVVLPSLGNVHKGISPWTHIFGILSEITISLHQLPSFHIISNVCKFTSHIIYILNSWIYLKSLGEDHLLAVKALLVLLCCCCCCTTPVVPFAIIGLSHNFSSFKDTFYNNHINS